MDPVRVDQSLVIDILVGRIASLERERAIQQAVVSAQEHLIRKLSHVGEDA